MPAIVGTAREWRGRGVASALIAASLQAARDNGIGIVSLGVDRENPTGAVGVYERMGFRPVEQSSVYALTLAWSARSCR
ncbi:MAG: GNAT family N-acetyltransferase [Mycobacteriales bacterium]